ncbi:hypothetical protein GIR22_10625 [Pseudomonas sp. CCM 7891]|uniref:Uncharacterized protein n=1 Tax=Pseudomonas karstica TaxID=1055468 RepID=A0A7X2RRA0_9PSED|nr:hypothetical protein [Pseudomonas karstica]MTD19583.1 hypothetical protein [Pseudomonas karstica]
MMDFYRSSSHVVPARNCIKEYSDVKGAYDQMSLNVQRQAPALTFAAKEKSVAASAPSPSDSPGGSIGIMAEAGKFIERAREVLDYLASGLRKIVSALSSLLILWFGKS